jgi:hypothetical protein
VVYSKVHGLTLQMEVSMFEIKVTDKVIQSEPDIMVRTDSEYGTSIKLILPDNTVLNIFISNYSDEVVYINHAK